MEVEGWNLGTGLKYRRMPVRTCHCLVCAIFRDVWTKNGVNCKCLTLAYGKMNVLKINNDHHHHHHMCLTSMTPNNTQLGIRTGQTPSNCPPSTTALCHSLLCTHSLHVSPTPLQVFLKAPLPTTPVTFILVHFFTQSFSSLSSACPNHLNFALWIWICSRHIQCPNDSRAHHYASVPM